MMLVLSLLLAVIPLLGIVGIVLYGSITTVDGLFMSLILLAMSGILGLNVLLEMKKRASGSAGQGLRRASKTVPGGLVEAGRVKSVEFYESAVGQPNKSIVVLSDGGTSTQMLVFEGDMRNALPVGQRVEITLRKATGYSVLMNVNYS